MSVSYPKSEVRALSAMQVEVPGRPAMVSTVLAAAFVLFVSALCARLRILTAGIFNQRIGAGGKDEQAQQSP